MKQFLAAYQDGLRQLTSKSADLKGFPLKTTVRIAFGGEHCAAAKGHDPAAGAGVPATQFEIPAGWKLIAAKERAPKEFSRPKAGS